jgi:hypothetical protein
LELNNKIEGANTGAFCFFAILTIIGISMLICHTPLTKGTHPLVDLGITVFSIALTFFSGITCWALATDPYKKFNHKGFGV